MRFLHPKNAPAPIILTFFGIIISSIAIFLKHPSSILSRPSWRITLTRLLQLLNASFPIDLILFGMTISLTAVKLKHQFPILSSPS